MLTVDKLIEVEPLDRLIGGLDLILKYGLKDSHDFWEFSSGLPAYEVWAEIFRKKRIDVYGNAFNIHE